jgi:hypothetical protein
MPCGKPAVTGVSNTGLLLTWVPGTDHGTTACPDILEIASNALLASDGLPNTNLFSCPVVNILTLILSIRFLTQDFSYSYTPCKHKYSKTNIITPKFKSVIPCLLTRVLRPAVYFIGAETIGIRVLL